MKVLTEFDKVYLVKYINALGASQIKRDLHIRNEDIENTIKELKENGLYDIYYNLADYEWEKIEKMKRQDILKIYIQKVKDNNKKTVKELLATFNVSIAETIMKFPIYNQVNFNFNYFQEQNYEGEEWKTIQSFNYSISNYGRIKNNKNNKLKTLRFHRWILQVDIYESGKRCTVCVPRLVANYFIREVKRNEIVFHKDGDYRNNYYKNLKIVSK